jgi:hypothetical protein
MRALFETPFASFNLVLSYFKSHFFEVGDETLLQLGTDFNLAYQVSSKLRGNAVNDVGAVYAHGG